MFLHIRNSRCEIASNDRRYSCRSDLIATGVFDQGGTSSADAGSALAMWEDGSIVLAGQTEGDWNGTNLGFRDFAAFKLKEDGTLQWKLQVTQFHGNLPVGPRDQFATQRLYSQRAATRHRLHPLQRWSAR